MLPDSSTTSRPRSLEPNHLVLRYNELRVPMAKDGVVYSHAGLKQGHQSLNPLDGWSIFVVFASPGDIF